MSSELETAPRAHVPQALRTASDWSWRIIVVAIVAGGALYVSTFFATMFISVTIAFLISVLLEPMNSFMKRKWKFPPAAAAACSLLFLTLFLLVLIGGAGTAFVSGMRDLADQTAAGIDTLVNWVKTGPLHLNIDTDHFTSNLKDLITNNRGRIFGGVMTVTSSAASILTGVMLVLFALFFFLKDGRGLWRWFVRLAPSVHRTTMDEAGIRAWVTISSYTRTQVIVAFVDALGIALVAFFLKTPVSLAFPIGVIVFLGSFIPIVGSLVTGTVAVLVVLVNTQSVTMAALMVVGVIAVQQIEGNVLQPFLQGNALNLHPLAIVLLVTAGSALAGIVGALFSVPIAAAINTMWLYAKGHDSYPYLADDHHRPGGAPGSLWPDTDKHWERMEKANASKKSPNHKRLVKEARARENSGDSSADSSKE